MEDRFRSIALHDGRYSPEAIRFLLENELRGPFNLVAPESVDNRTFARAVGRRMGRPSFLPAPAFALGLALGEKASIVLEGQKVIPRRLLEAGFTFRYPTVDAALAELDEGALVRALSSATATGGDTDTMLDGLTNVGHGKNIWVNGKLQRLDWGHPSVRQQRADLVEYLKTR